MTLDEFAAALEEAIATVEPRLVIGLGKLGVVAEKLSKDMIGHEHPGLWPPLAPSTIADKARKGFPVPAPLLRTGDMRDSIAFKVDPVDLAVTVGSESEIALFQEMGTSKIPPRPFLSEGMKESLPVAEKIFGEIASNLLIGKSHDDE